jgi:DNA ligase-4
LELKWLSRLILKDLKLGIGHEALLKLYHPQSLEIFNATSDLKQVFIGDYQASTFKLFFAVKPMLAGKLTLSQISELCQD